MADEHAAQDENTKRGIQPVKIYVKDVSFETPNSPAIFRKEWKPQLGMEIGNGVAMTQDGLHEVVLTVTVTMKVNDETAYLAEVHQAGLFAISGFDEAETKRIHRIACNRMLYPYACAALSDLVTRGGFQQLLLSPVNWEQIYQQQQQEAGATAENQTAQ